MFNKSKFIYRKNAEYKQQKSVHVRTNIVSLWLTDSSHLCYMRSVI